MAQRPSSQPLPADAAIDGVMVGRTPREVSSQEVQLIRSLSAAGPLAPTGFATWA